jgi:hypothetical protein
MQPALRTVFLRTVVLPSVIPIPAAASGGTDAAVSFSGTGISLVIPAIGLIAILVMAAILWYSLRLVRGFYDSTTALIDMLRALTPMPVVTLSGRIPGGLEGHLEIRISGFTDVPIEDITVVLAPPPGLDLETNHLVLPHLDPDETRIVRIAHGPAHNGRYVVGVTIRYLTGGREMVREFTRTVYAGIPAEPETIDEKRAGPPGNGA